MNQFADRSDEHLAVIRELWPRIDAKSLIRVGDGWTSDTYEVDGSWIAQFPRSDYANRTLRRQMVALPQLALHLSTRIPTPVRPQPSNTVAMLYPRIGGVPFPDAPDGPWPEELGRMLRELQAVVPEHVGLACVSAEELRQERAEQLHMMSERVLPVVSKDARVKFELAFAGHVAKDELWQFEPVLTHADLGPEHILVDSDGDLAGVIDWEEVAPGDPAIDFAWLLFEKPEIGRRVLEAAGTRVNRAWEERARFIYALMPLHDVIYGLDTNQQLFVDLGVRGIERRAKWLE